MIIKKIEKYNNNNLHYSNHMLFSAQEVNMAYTRSIEIKVVGNACTAQLVPFAKSIIVSHIAFIENYDLPRLTPPMVQADTPPSYSYLAHFPNFILFRLAVGEIFNRFIKYFGQLSDIIIEENNLKIAEKTLSDIIKSYTISIISDMADKPQFYEICKVLVDIKCRLKLCNSRISQYNLEKMDFIDELKEAFNIFERTK